MMMTKVSAGLALLALLSTVLTQLVTGEGPEDDKHKGPPAGCKEVSDGKAAVRACKKGAVILLARKKEDLEENGPRATALKLTKIAELKADGTPTSVEIDESEFDKTDFDFSADGDSTYEGLATRHFNASAVFPNQGKLELQMYMFKGDGNFTFGNEENDVKKGDMKMNMIVSNWQWSSAEAVKLEVIFTIIPPGATHNKRKLKRKLAGGLIPGNARNLTRPDKFEFGDDNSRGEVQMSKIVSKDGVFEDMESGYPKMENMGGKAMFTVVFPRFQNSAFYDPTITPPDEDVSDSGMVNYPRAIPTIMATILAITLLM